MKKSLYQFKHSLTWRMTAILLCSTCVVWLLFSAVLVWQAERMTQGILAQQLTQYTDMLWQYVGDDDDVQPSQTRRLRHDNGLEFALYDVKKNQLINASSTPALPRQATGLVQIGHEHWMMQSRSNDEIELVVGAPNSSTTELSHEMAENIGLLALAGLLLLIPVLYFALRRGLRPIDAFTTEVASRAVDNLAPIQTFVPTELQPLKNRLNGLFGQVEQTIAREQRFTADAAHELRTPLAAIRLQLELAHTSQRPEIRDKAFNNATHAVDRATHVVSQLLLLARLEHGANIEHQPIDFAQIAHDALTEAGKPVDAAHLMIDGAPQLLGQPMLWALVLRNLIDNAHHYAGDAAQVFIQISTRQITVYDTGKGMDAAQKARLGERFYRPAGQAASGAGLGWSIIQRIAQLHHTRIEMFDVQPHGFGVRFDF